jgi:hypothetical protein
MNINEVLRRYDDHRLTVEPDWSSVSIQEVPTPWNEGHGHTIQATFSDPVLTGYRAMIIEDTIDHEPEQDEDLISPHRITTMVVRYPRMILPEFNTHRVFSRNSASSRARSIKTTLRPVIEDPMIPLWTQNQKGMGGSFATIDHARSAAVTWMKARDAAVESMLRLLMSPSEVSDYARVEDWETRANRYDREYKAQSVPNAWSNIHKQDANRLLEPWMWHETLVTSTYWKNFYDLRISEYAQPEIKAIAILMQAVMKQSLDHHVLRYDALHIPFMDRQSVNDTISWGDLEEILLASASECARISYNDRDVMKNKDLGLGRKLLEQKHMSPFEHIAWSSDESEYAKYPAIIEAMDSIHNRNLSSNLSDDWIQFRRVVSAREQ